MLTKEMMKALEADGEKLRQLTGEDHGPHFFFLEEELEEACKDCGARPGDDRCCFYCKAD